LRDGAVFEPVAPQPRPKGQTECRAARRTRTARAIALRDESCGDGRLRRFDGEAAAYAAADFGLRPRRATALPGIPPAQPSQRSAAFAPRRASVNVTRMTAPFPSSTSAPHLSQTRIVFRAIVIPLRRHPRNSCRHSLDVGKYPGLILPLNHVSINCDRCEKPRCEVPAQTATGN
jgi:hypothetical protein